MNISLKKIYDKKGTEHMSLEQLLLEQKLLHFYMDFFPSFSSNKFPHFPHDILCLMSTQHRVIFNLFSIPFELNLPN